MNNILIVDDIQSNRILLNDLLESQGYRVSQAEHGEQALEVAHEDPPDLIISDILMPVMDGFALCQIWKADERLRKIPFIFYTANYTHPKDKEFALDLGADRFLEKPIASQLFFEIIENVLDEFKAGELEPTRESIGQKELINQKYNQALVRKLEDKMLQLGRLHRILDFSQACAQLGSWFYFPGSQLSLWSKQMFAIYDLDPQVGPPLLEAYYRLIHPDDIDMLQHIQAEVLRSGVSQSVDFRSNPELGSMRYLHGTYDLMQDDPASEPYLAGTVQDVSDIHQNESLEERVRDRTLELKKFLDVMTDREVRMAELKKVIKKLRAQLKEAGIEPAANDPLVSDLGSEQIP